MYVRIYINIYVNMYMHIYGCINKYIYMLTKGRFSYETESTATVLYIDTDIHICIYVYICMYVYT